MIEVNDLLTSRALFDLVSLLQCSAICYAAKLLQMLVMESVEVCQFLTSNDLLSLLIQHHHQFDKLPMMKLLSKATNSQLIKIFSDIFSNEVTRKDLFWTMYHFIEKYLKRLDHTVIEAIWSSNLLKNTLEELSAPPVVAPATAAVTAPPAAATVATAPPPPAAPAAAAVPAAAVPAAAVPAAATSQDRSNADNGSDCDDSSDSHDMEVVVRETKACFHVISLYCLCCQNQKFTPDESVLESFIPCLKKYPSVLLPCLAEILKKLPNLHSLIPSNLVPLLLSMKINKLLSQCVLEITNRTLTLRDKEFLQYLVDNGLLPFLSSSLKLKQILPSVLSKLIQRIVKIDEKYLESITTLELHL
jgi:hypothetical protein